MLLLLASSALAEWNVAGYIGGAHTQNSDARVRLSGNTDLRLGNVPWEGRSFDGPLYYGVRFGAFPHRRFGYQTEFTHMKVYARTAERVSASGTLNGAPVAPSIVLNSVVQRFSMSHGANLILGSFVFRQPLLTSDERELGRVLLTARAGLGGMIAHVEGAAGGRTIDEWAGGGFAWQVAGGGEVQLWRGVYALGEYKFTQARPRVVLGSGTSDFNLNSHHGVTGLSLHF